MAPTRTFLAAQAPRSFDVRLPPLQLIHGGRVESHHARGWWWGPEVDEEVLDARTHALSREEAAAASAPIPRARDRKLAVRADAGVGLDPDIPTVLLIHALTGDARAGGPDGWWEPLIGPGRALDPSRVRILCFNNLGSCYGSSGPLDCGFPEHAKLTPWDTARALGQALDALEVETLALVSGGSLGGMVATAFASLHPDRVHRLLPLATSATASAWVLGWNHVARQILAATPDDRGLELARQLAMLTYRAEPGLHARHRTDSPIQTYLEHQGEKLRRRFDAQAYALQLGVMDQHDLTRPPALFQTGRVRAPTLLVDVDSDQLFTREQTETLATWLRGQGAFVERATLSSVHGHDGFLLEWDALAPLVRRALELPVSDAQRERAASIPVAVHAF